MQKQSRERHLHNEHYELEQHTSESEERYRSLVGKNAQLFWTTSVDGTVEDVPLWRAYTGQSKEEVQGWGCTSANDLWKPWKGVSGRRVPG
jgi:hypothetical protein